MARGDRTNWNPGPNDRLNAYTLTHPEEAKQLREFLGQGPAGLEISRMQKRSCAPEILMLYADVIEEEIRRESASAPIQRARLKRVAEGLAGYGKKLKPALWRYV